MNNTRLRVVADPYYDPSDLPEELRRDFTRGELFAYDAVLEVSCPCCGEWREYDCVGTLLNREYWVGVYYDRDRYDIGRAVLSADADMDAQGLRELWEQMERERGE